MIDVSKFGAGGDGTDQTSQIRTAMNSAQKGEIIHFPVGLYKIKGEVSIPPNVGGIECEAEAVFTLDARETRCGFLWRSPTNVFWRGGSFIVLGAYEHHEAAIHCLDADGLEITNVKFRGDGPDDRMQKGAAVFVRGREKPARNVIISGLDIKSLIGTDKTTPVPLRIDGKLPGIQRDHWKATKTPLASTVSPQNVVVRNNLVDGGYYGCDFSGVETSVIEFNTFQNNTRGVSAQDCSSYNVIRYNTIKENVSAGIHLAYGSSYNLVAHNTLTSTKAHGEGMLQAYVASKYNRFVGNYTHCEGVGAKYHFYTGIHADGNQCVDNVFSGVASRAFMAAESDWDSTLPFNYHRAFNAPNDDHYANTGTKDVLLMRNVINGEGLKVVLGAIGTYPLEVVYKDKYDVTRIGEPTVR